MCYLYLSACLFRWSVYDSNLRPTDSQAVSDALEHHQKTGITAFSYAADMRDVGQGVATNADKSFLELRLQVF